ncbi:MAG: gliding motility-associated C-terminal domain-containing protein [Marinifilaceae bacterium]|jgi:hypothetical protein|nr:gliding motility-associated C-terminal domain-containing protein [Marinifilaceae bacterium]
MKKLLYFLLLGVISLPNIAFAQKTNVFNINTSMHIGTSMCIAGDLIDQSKEGISCSGSLYFINENENTISLSEFSDFSEGSIYLKGSAESYLNAANLKLANLNLFMYDANLKIEGNVSVSDVLELNSGKIICYNQCQLHLGQDIDIRFNDNLQNKSYICAPLKQTVISGNSYVFPVGDIETYSPIKVNDITEDTELTVNFNKNVVDLWKKQNPNSMLEFISNSGWQINSSNENSSFNFSLGLDESFIDNEIDEKGDKKFSAILMWDYLSQLDDNYKVTRDIENDLNSYYINSNDKFNKGVLGLIKTYLGFDEEENDFQIFNIVVADSPKSTTKFIVPDIHNFQSVKLLIYDNLGFDIYTSNNYDNSFDFKEFKNGTYYYFLKVVKKNGRLIDKKGMIEVVRYN